MLDGTTSAYVLLGTGSLILALGFMLFIMSAKYYNSLQLNRKAYINLIDHKILVHKYADILQLYIQKERNLTVLMEDYSALLKMEGIDMPSPCLSSMAIQAELADEILTIYEEIVHSQIPEEELTPKN